MLIMVADNVIEYDSVTFLITITLKRYVSKSQKKARLHYRSFETIVTDENELRAS